MIDNRLKLSATDR